MNCLKLVNCEKYSVQFSTTQDEEQQQMLITEKLGRRSLQLKLFKSIIKIAAAKLRVPRYSLNIVGTSATANEDKS